MTHFIKPEYLVSLYLILNEQEIVTLKDLGDYAQTLNRELIERKIEAVFLFSDKYIEEMLNLYKDCFISGTYTIYDAVKRIVPNEVLSEKFTAYLSNDVLKVACDLNDAKDAIMSTEEKIKIMQAYTEGKEIQSKAVIGEQWCDDTKPTWDWNHFEYRIKPEPTYRPYKNLEEFKQDIVRKYGGASFENILETRNIWLKSKCKECIGRIDKLTTDNVFVDGSDKSWLCVFNYYSYLDGTPFGIKE